MGRPVILSSSIRKPTIFCAEDSQVAYGFVNLVCLFEKLDKSLYDFSGANHANWHHEMSSRMEWPAAVYNDVCSFQPLVDEALETQKVDLLVTRDWLRITLLKRSMDTHSCLPRWSSVIPDVTLLLAPISCAKSILDTVASASRGSVAAHGIGMVSRLSRLSCSKLHPRHYFGALWIFSSLQCKQDTWIC